MMFLFRSNWGVQAVLTGVGRKGRDIGHKMCTVKVGVGQGSQKHEYSEFRGSR